MTGFKSGERGDIKLLFLYETPVYEHPGCSRIQECRCGDGCKGGELDLDIDGTVSGHVQD